MNETKELTQLEIDNILNEAINLSILNKLKELKVLTEQQFYILKEKIRAF